MLSKLYRVLLLGAMLFSIANIAHAQNRYWVSSSSSNWNNTANWSTNSAGTGGASVPTTGNVAIFNGVGGNGTCNLDIAPTVAGISMSGYSGTIDFHGFSLTSTGTHTFATGTLVNTGGAASLILNTSGSTTFSGSTFNINITGSSGRIFFNGSVFNGTLALTKTTNATDNSLGGNEFNAATSLTNASTHNMQLAAQNPDVFLGVLTLTINNTGDISLSRVVAGNQFNDNIIVNYNGLGSVRFGQNGGESSLANGMTISVGSTGTSGSGGLHIANFTQLGTTPQTITLSGNNTSTLTIGPQSTFNGDLTFTSPSFGLQTSTFNAGIQITKTGSTTDNLRGGNIFAGPTVIINEGADLIFGSNSGDAGDTFNGSSTFYNLGGNRIRISEETSGTVFNGNATFICSGTTDVANRIQISRLTGGETTFNGPATFISNGTGSDIHISYDAGTSTTFNGPVSFTSSAIGGGDFFVGVDGDVDFADNIEFNSTVGDVIYLSQDNGNVSFANGVMTVGLSGFALGELRLQKFTQTGTAAQSLTLTGTAALQLGPSSEFNGPVNFVAPQVMLNGSNFKNTAYIEKNGATDNSGDGGNIFAGATTLTNSSPNRWRQASASGDIYNGDVTFIRSGAGTFEVAYSQTNNFAGNITLNSVGGISFGAGGGTVRINGDDPQTISKTVGSASPTIPRLTLAKPTNAFTLSTDLTVSTNATFTGGIINSTVSNYLNFAAGSTATGANNASYVNGPVRKTGNNAFTFPVGAGNFYRPISISAPGNSTHQFTAQYFRSAQGFGGASTWDPTFYTISGCEYWTLDRTTGTSNVTVNLSWNDAACGGSGYITNLSSLRVARFNVATSRWVNEGNSGTTGTASSGTITSGAAVTTFSPFAIASTSPVNPLPIELASFWATDEDGLVGLNWITHSEINNEKFTLQRSPTGFDFEQIGVVPGAGNSAEKLTYTFIDEAPLGGLSYYRLKQTDFDGKESYSNVISVHRKGTGLAFQVYPNPAGYEWIQFNQKANIIIVNSMDQLILTAQEAERIDVSKLAPGVYIIKNQKGEIVRFVRE